MIWFMLNMPLAAAFSAAPACPAAEAPLAEAKQPEPVLAA